MKNPSSLLLICALCALTAPQAGSADPLAPLAPPPRFDPLAVPLAPIQPQATAPVRVPAPQPPVVPGWRDPSQPAPPLPTDPIRIQSQTAPPPEAGAALIERGAGIILQNLLEEMQPTFDQMAQGLDGVAERFGPALGQLGALVDDIGNYQPPERLPNGDIVIRRRADAPPPPPPGDALRDLVTPDATPVPRTVPDGPTGTVPPNAVPAEPPALAAPIPVIPPGTQIDL